MESRTVVTPYVYNLFVETFGDEMLKKVESPIRRCEKVVSVEVHQPTRAPREDSGKIRPSNTKIRVGDVAVLKRDKKTKWKGRNPNWFVYVRAIEDNGFLRVTWLYAPEDTILAQEKYPYHNEVGILSKRTRKVLKY